MVKGEDPRPPRGYSWAPFEPGHELSMRHGAYSPRRVEPLAVEILDHVLDASPHLGAPHWRLAVNALCRAEARTQLLHEYLLDRASEVPPVGDLADEKVLAAYNQLHRAEAHADRLRARLGLDPLSAARLGRDHAATGVDIARLMAELEARPAPEGEDGPETPPGTSTALALSNP